MLALLAARQSSRLASRLPPVLTGLTLIELAGFGMGSESRDHAENSGRRAAARSRGFAVVSSLESGPWELARSFLPTY